MFQADGPQVLHNVVIGGDSHMSHVDNQADMAWEQIELYQYFELNEQPLFIDDVTEHINQLTSH